MPISIEHVDHVENAHLCKILRTLSLVGAAAGSAGQPVLGELVSEGWRPLVHVGHCRTTRVKVRIGRAEPNQVVRLPPAYAGLGLPGSPLSRPSLNLPLCRPLAAR